MRRSKIIHFLKALSPAEIVRFDQYIHSPYFGAREETQLFFRILRIQYPDFHKERIQKQYIWNLMYPEEGFDEQKIYFLSSYLFKHLTHFLSIEEQKSLQEINLIASLERRGMDNYVPGILQKTQQELDKKEERDDDYYLAQFQLAQLHSNYTLRQENRGQHETYQQILFRLEVFYLINRFRYALALVNQLQILKGKDNPDLITSVLAQYQAGNYSQVPLLRLQFECLQMLLKSNEDEHFFRLTQGLEAPDAYLSQNDAYELYSYALNYCSRRYRQGKSEFLRQMFELYSRMMDRNVLFFNSAIATHIFKNLITLGLRLEEYDWIEMVIQTHGDKLPEQYRNGIISYSQALLHFQKKEFGRAQKSLANVEFIDPFYRLSYDLLLIKIYYECNEHLLLLSRGRAFRTYIRRNRSLSEQHKQAYVNMEKITQKLARVKLEGKKNLLTIKEEMKTCANLVERQWLHDKAEELNDR